MPSKKIFVILIICVAIIISISIFQKSASTQVEAIKDDVQLKSGSRENIQLSYDWQKILNTSSTTTTFINNTETVDDTTITNDVAKTFFAQYLLLKKEGKTVTQEDALSIAKKTISTSEYSKIMGVQYNMNNIHVSNTVNPEIINSYYNSLGTISKMWLSHKISEEFTITNKAISTKNEKELVKLDPIIANYRKIIIMLLEMKVPEDAAQLHLELLNNTSNILFSTEAMRVSFSDPVKGMLGLDRYQTYLQNLGKSIKKIDLYFATKGIK